MSDLTAQNIIKYAVTILAGALAAALGVLAVQLAGTDPIAWRPVAVAAIGPVVTGLAAMQLTRVGSEAIAAQVDSLKAGGTDRRDMAVIKQADIVPVITGALTDAQLAQITDALRVPVVDALQARMQATPADSLVSKPPTWLPGTSPSTPIGPPPPDFDWTTKP